MFLYYSFHFKILGNEKNDDGYNVSEDSDDGEKWENYEQGNN